MFEPVLQSTLNKYWLILFCYLGSEFVEPAPLAPCAKLVIDAKREQRKKEQALQEAEERKRIEESKQRTEEKKAGKKVKHVTIQSPKHEDWMLEILSYFNCHSWCL